MPKLSLTDLAEGMVVGTNATDKNGRVVVKAGTRLTDKHLRRLKTWGVQSVDVGGSDARAATPPSSGDASQRIALRVRHRFRHNRPHHPLIKALARHCVRTARQKLKKAA